MLFRSAKNAPRRKTRQPAQEKSIHQGAQAAASAGFIDTAWFKRILAEKHLSQRQLAFKMGIDPGAMSLMLHGKRGMSASEAASMAAWINVPVEEILMRAGVSQRTPARASRCSARQKRPACRPVRLAGPEVSDCASGSMTGRELTLR